MAFTVLESFADRKANAEILDLGSITDDSIVWADERCGNPDRLMRMRSK
jgi:hypothetical protein